MLQQLNSEFMKKNLGLLILTLLIQAPFLTLAYDATEKMPIDSSHELKQLENLGVDEGLGAELNLSRQFTNEDGNLVPLSTYYDGKRPVLLTMVYYSCPSLCNYHLNGLVDTFKKMDQHVGSDFQVVAVSMNHREDSDLAAAKLESYLKELGQPGAKDGMHFLVGTQENVEGLAKELGFKFRWDEKQKQYAHAAVAYVTTPSGTISRYLYGIEFSPKTLRLSLVEAAQGRIGNLIEQVILFCFQFNPAKNKYTLYSYNIMRASAALTAIILAIFLVPVWLREHKKKS